MVIPFKVGDVVVFRRCYSPPPPRLSATPHKIAGIKDKTLIFEGNQRRNYDEKWIPLEEGIALLEEELTAIEAKLKLYKEFNNKCPKCGKEEKSPVPHPCPYEDDVNNNETTLCYCCKTCEGSCADDI